jgi:hypothetical protein
MFAPRIKSGGSPQKFCSSKCRQASHTPAEAFHAGLPAVIDPPAPKPAKTSPKPVEDASEFDWSADESVVLHHQPAIACYINAAGGLTIR